MDTKGQRAVVDDFVESFGIDGCLDPNGSEFANVSHISFSKIILKPNHPNQTNMYEKDAHTPRVSYGWKRCGNGRHLWRMRYDTNK